MKQTIAQTKIAEMTAKGYRLIGKTQGTFSFAKGSNLSRKLESLGLTKNDVEVVAGARAGRYQNDGYELLIFSK